MPPRGSEPIASLNYLMNLFPRRSYFLLAISMGPTSLYPDKPSPKSDPFFGTLKKNRSVRTIKMAVVSRRDLSFSILSRRKPFTKKHTFQGGDDGDGGGGGGRISRPSQTPSHHAGIIGISYPVRVQPLTPTWLRCGERPASAKTVGSGGKHHLQTWRH